MQNHHNYHHIPCAVAEWPRYNLSIFGVLEKCHVFLQLSIFGQNRFEISMNYNWSTTVFQTTVFSAWKGIQDSQNVHLWFCLICSLSLISACLQFTSCTACIASEINFNCSWCHRLNRWEPFYSLRMLVSSLQYITEAFQMLLLENWLSSTWLHPKNHIFCLNTCKQFLCDIKDELKTAFYIRYR